MKQKITIGEKYGPAMEIRKQSEADAYFEKCVEHNLMCCRMEGLPPDRTKAEQIERANLGYYAGYYSHKVRARVERLFKCEHPVFGAIKENGAPTATEALAAGILRGIRSRNEQRLHPTG